MTTQPLDLKKLRELADRSKSAGDDWYSESEVTEAIDALSVDGVQLHADSEFIATFNPQTILALLDAYEASARDAEYWKEAAHAAEDRISSQPLVDVINDDMLSGKEAVNAIASFIQVGTVALDGDIGRVTLWLPRNMVGKTVYLYDHAYRYETSNAARHATQGD